MSIQKMIRGAAVLMVAQSLIACGVSPEEQQALHTLDEETLGQQAQALGEYSCTDSAVSLAQPDGAVVTYSYPHCGYADIAQISNDGSYDQPLCPNQFITEVRQVNDMPFTAFVEAVPASQITTESACEGIAVGGAAWGLKGSVWYSLGKVTFAGVWHPASCGDLFCFPAYCDLRGEIASTSGYSKVRVSGFATALFIAKGRVKVGVHAGSGPC